MINSPSLTVSNTAPKVSNRTSVTAENAESGGFSQYLERANNTEKASAVRSRNTEKNDIKQKDERDSSANLNDHRQLKSDKQERTDAIDEAYQEESRGQSARGDQDDQGLSKADNSQQTAEDSGKVLQENGQKIAQGTHAEESSLNAEGETTESLDVDDQEKNLEGLVSNESASLQEQTGAEQEANLEQKESQEPIDTELHTKVEHPIIEEKAKVPADSDAKPIAGEPEADLEAIGNSQPPTTEENLASSVANKLDQELDSDGLVADSTVVDASQVTASESGNTAVEGEQDISIITTVNRVEGLSDQSVPDEATDSVDDIPASNLRWVVDQLSVKTGKTSLAQALEQSNAELVKSPLNFESEATIMPEGILTDDLSETVGNKKSLEQLMSSLSGQLQNSFNQSNTSIANAALNQAATAQAGTLSRGAEGQSQAPQLTMQTMPNSAAWTAEMTTKVSWVAKEGFTTAKIHLDPPELGSLMVKITMDQDANTQVSFVASSLQAKDALEGQMQRLREMLQQQGVEVGDVDVEVSQGNGQSTDSGQFEGDEGNGDSRGLGLASDDLDAEDELENMSYINTADRGIDFYA